MRVLLTSGAGNRRFHRQDRVFQSNKNSLRNDAVTDIEFFNFGNAGNCTYVSQGQAVTSRHV